MHVLVAVAMQLAFVVGMAAVYLALDNTSKAFGGKLRTHVDALYFSSAAHTSTGFGDLAPVTQPARALVALHIFLVWAVLLRLSMSSS